MKKRNQFHTDFFFLKTLYQLKVSGQHLNFNIFKQPSTGAYNKNKLYKTLVC